MARRKMQQPLLYIQQPLFERQTAPMQQFFMTKRSKEKENQQCDNVTNEVKEVEQEEIEHNLTTVPFNTQNLEEAETPKVELALEDEIAEPNVMDFMLESILTSGFESDVKVADFPTIPPLDSIKKTIPKAKVNSSKNTTRTPFNKLNLVNKLRRLKKMPADVAKFLYEFVTEGTTVRGYFLSSKEKELVIQPLNSTETILIPEISIIDIKTIGL